MPTGCSARSRNTPRAICSARTTISSATPTCRAAFSSYLWDTIEAGEEIFAYVVNQAKSGDHYWVFAHITPTFDAEMKIAGYHSSRRVPRRAAVDAASGLYRHLLAIEKSHAGAKEGMLAAEAALMDILKSKNLAYDEFVFSL